MLLAGPPGIGKTRFAKRLAELLELGYGEFGAAGSSDDRALRTGCANPVILVDEIDKAGGNERNGDIRQTLLGLLEAETARMWFDEALLAPCDLSAVSWLFTANETAPLSAPMLSRLSIIRCPAPRAEDFAAIAASILEDIARAQPAASAEMGRQSSRHVSPGRAEAASITQPTAAERAGDPGRHQGDERTRRHGGCGGEIKDATEPERRLKTV